MLQEYDSSRDVAVNEEINQLSDKIHQLRNELDDISNSQKNNANNMQASAGSVLFPYIILL